MKLRASEYVSKAEELKASELSVRQKLEGIRSQRSKFQSIIDTLENRLDFLYERMSAIDSYDSDDEDGFNNRAAVEAIMEEIAETKYEISVNQEEDAELRSQEMQASAEILRIEREEQQTLSEIQDSAERTSHNIALISGFGGDYSNVSAQAAGAFQQKLAQFSQAAQILGGTVVTGSVGTGARALGRLAMGNLGVSNGSSNRNFYEAANRQRKDGARTGILGTKGSGCPSGNRKEPELYAGAAPTDEPPVKKSGGLGGKGVFNQTPVKRNNSDADDRLDLPGAGRHLADDIDYEYSVGAILSKLRKKNKDIDDNVNTGAHISSDRRREKFIEQLHVDDVPKVKKTGESSGASDDDFPSKDERIREHDYRDSDRESQFIKASPSSRKGTSDSHSDINSIKKQFELFLNKKSENKHVVDPLVNTQRIIDQYSKKELCGVLSESKRKVRLADTVEFQNDADFAAGLGGAHKAAGINGYNHKGIKSFVKSTGPHPQKTAIHEHNHQLSCNDVKDKYGNIIERRRGVSINGRDRQINEAITEYFTKKMMGSDYPAAPKVAYKDNMLRIEKMEQGFGEGALKKAYYQNQPRLLARKYEATMGKGYTWADLSKAFDDTLKEYTQQEIQTIRYYYHQTGKRLVTQTDIIRKKATDYANKCAALFAVKSKKGNVKW